MYEEPEDAPDDEGTRPARPVDPAQAARDKADEIRMHAELAAIYEGPRKFDAQVRPGLDAGLAREVQQAVGRLAKAREPETPVLPAASWPAAAELLVTLPEAHDLATNDYHVHRRPGEAMLVRWLAGEQVEQFYERMQAHFDVAMTDCRDTERQSNGWRQDARSQAYLAALDALDIRMTDRYLRDAIRKHGVFVCSTLAADEIHIGYLCNHLMGIDVADLVGDASAPPPGAPDHEMAWFYKLFSIRGIVGGIERMCFFTYLQKSDDELFDDA